MSADFWAGYLSGAIGIIVGNPLDIIKTKLQAGSTYQRAKVVDQTTEKFLQRWTSLARGATAPVLGYGTLNALLFVTYNRSLALLNTGDLNTVPIHPTAWSIWTAGGLGGLGTFFVSTPTELVKCRAQVSNPPKSSLAITQELWQQGGLRALYLGGGVTSVRDAVGYGFYFWSYEMSKRALTAKDESEQQQALKVLLCGGLAGVATWASIFPLDVIKTRVQTWDFTSRPFANGEPPATQPLLRPLEQEPTTRPHIIRDRPSTFHIAREACRVDGVAVMFRGLGICCVRAFIVNAVQWAIYERMIKLMKH